MNIDEKFSAEFRWTDELGGSDYSKLEVSNLESELLRFAAELYELTAKNARAKQLVSTGSLLDPANFKASVTEQGKGKESLEIYMVKYFDYINQGVMGFKSKKPDSPYKFKDSFSMSPEGRASIRNWLEKNREIKLDAKKKDIVGLEGKEGNGSKKKITKSELDIRTDQAIAGIKSGGIKRTDYFNEALDVALKNFKERVGDQILKDIKVQIIVSNNKFNTK